MDRNGLDLGAVALEESLCLQNRFRIEAVRLIEADQAER
jgi:hypothetical protein